MISQEEADKLKPAIENYFKEQLVKIRTKAEPDHDTMNDFRQDMMSISSGIIGKEKTEKLAGMYEKYIEEEKKKKEANCKKKSACEQWTLDF